MRRIVFAVLALALVLSVRTSAQMPTAQRWENVEWYIVMNWEFTGADAYGRDAMEPVNIANQWCGG